MNLQVDHSTLYHYNAPVTHSIQLLRLTPINTDRQHINYWEIDMPGHASEVTDAYGNVMHVMTIDTPHEEIKLSAKGEVFISPDRKETDTHHLSPYVYLKDSHLTLAGEGVASFLDSLPSNLGPHKKLENLMVDILSAMPYKPGSTSVCMNAEEAIKRNSGVCQDHSHVFIACCRRLGIPARYVSGYIYSNDDEHVAMHAWCEAWLNEQWMTFDVTNQSANPSQHLKLAVGLDYLDACPVRGVRFGGGHEILTSTAHVNKITTENIAQ